MLTITTGVRLHRIRAGKTLRASLYRAIASSKIEEPPNPLFAETAPIREVRDVPTTESQQKTDRTARPASVPMEVDVARSLTSVPRVFGRALK